MQAMMLRQDDRPIQIPGLENPRIISSRNYTFERPFHRFGDQILAYVCSVSGSIDFVQTLSCNRLVKSSRYGDRDFSVR